MTGLVMDGSSFLRPSVLGRDDASCRRCRSKETESLSRLEPQVPSSSSRPTVAGRARSDESGRNEIYVRPFDPHQSRSAEAGTPYTIVSKGNVATMLGWRDDGRELWYVTPDSTVMSVALRLDRTVEAGETMPLFQLPPGVGVGQPGTGHYRPTAIAS